MSIQFACRSCGRAIEVDDEWAHRLVECPYCHDTVTAPGISSFHAPQVRKVETPPAWPSEGAVAPAAPVAPGGNAIALVALVLAVAAVGLLIWVTISCGPAWQQAMEGATSQEEMQKIFTTAFEKQEPWAVRMGLGMLGLMGLWLTGIICSLVGICRRPRRAAAIVALLIQLGLAAMLLSGMAGA